MSVYVDRSQNPYGRMRMCHMIASTEEELHAFAAALGLRREWFQPRSFPHYDLSKTRRVQAIRLGAISLGMHEFVAVLQRLKAERREREVLR